MKEDNVIPGGVNNAEDFIDNKYQESIINTYQTYARIRSIFNYASSA